MQDLTYTARPVPGITHPLIAEIYCKKDFGLSGHDKEVLVIETRHLKEANDNLAGFFPDFIVARHSQPQSNGQGTAYMTCPLVEIGLRFIDVLKKVLKSFCWRRNGRKNSVTHHIRFSIPDALHPLFAVLNSFWNQKKW